MTTRLYYTDATCRTFRARVTRVEDDGRTVYLDATAFYPTSGGQPHDTGTLGGVPVADVIERDGEIAHLLGAPLLVPAGADADGEVNWARRLDHMQQHSGQHLLSAVIEDMLALATVSVHFGAESSTLDVAAGPGDTELLDAATIAAIEQRANEVVGEARAITVSFEDAATAGGLRKPSDREGELRIVTIEGLDRSACGGTHVANTAAIGPILLRRQEKVRQGLRIEFTCGARALRRARRDLELLQQVARVFSGAIDDSASLVESQAAALRELESGHRRALEALARYRAAELRASSAPDDSGLRWIVERVAGAGADSQRALALAASALPGVAFVSAGHAPPSVLLATSADSGLDAGRALQPLLQRVGGRGGGSPRLAQGSAPSPEAIEAVVKALTSGREGAVAPPEGSR